MLLGPIIDSSGLIFGGLIGAFGGQHIPYRIKNLLPLTFGIVSATMGINLINDVNILPVVVISLIMGSMIGELFYIESGTAKIALYIKKMVDHLIPPKEKLHETTFQEKFVALLVLFCASGTGVIGAMTEGMTGSPSILIVKAILDFFTALVFAASMGYSIISIAFLQFLIQSILFLLGKLIFPLTTPAMIGDFSAVGGVIMLATGLRICEIKSFPVANMLPSLLLIMPLHAIWTKWF